MEAIEKVMKKYITPLETKINSVLSVVEKLEAKIVDLESQIASRHEGNHRHILRIKAQLQNVNFTGEGFFCFI